MQALGDFIAGRFVAPDGKPLCSTNPARSGEKVLDTAYSAARIDDAASAADEAYVQWAAL